MPQPRLPAYPTPSYDIPQQSEPSSSYQRPGPTIATMPTPTLSPTVHVQREAVFAYPDGSLQKDLWAARELSQDAGWSDTKGKRPAHDNRDRGQFTPDQSPPPDHQLNLPSRHQRRATTYPTCDDEGNAVLACYPTSGTSVFQNQWTKFIWNVRIPEFIGLPGTIDIYLYHADSGELVEKWTGIPNVQGEIDVNANDTFWDYRMSEWQPGEQTPYTYYYVAVKSGTKLTGGESRLATWTVIQTALANSVYAAATSSASVSSVSSASIASSLSALGTTSLSMLSVSSQSQASIAAAATASAASGAGSLQGPGGDQGNSFPAWAIALLVVLGVLAFASMAGLFYLLIRTFRRRDRRGSSLTHRESMGSSSPMMGQTAGSLDHHAPHSPDRMLSPPPNYGARTSNISAGMGAGLAGAAVKSPSGMRQTSSAMHRDDSSARSVSDAGPISGQDAAIMADAFRLALRKPDFADRPFEEGESPDTHPSNPSREMGAGTPGRRKSSDGMLGSALAEEGNQLRNVGSARGVTVQHPSDDSIGSQERKSP
ncbi:hypothetical protein FRB95_010285 [Tulasnella sp. JGI-2019a]|nr:hypothetical protein FRB95_010285 [Tulasnella sp. JGI-2019a]